MKLLSVRVPDFVYNRLKSIVDRGGKGNTNLTEAARQALTNGLDTTGSLTEDPVAFLTRVHTALFGGSRDLGLGDCERFLSLIHSAFMLTEKSRYASAECVRALGRVAIALLDAAESAGYETDDGEKHYLFGNIGYRYGESGRVQDAIKRHLGDLPETFPAAHEEMFSRVPLGLFDIIRRVIAPATATMCLKAEAGYLYPAAVLGARREWRDDNKVDFSGLPGARALGDKFSAGDERNGEVAVAVSMFGNAKGDPQFDVCFTFTFVGEVGTLFVSGYPFGVLSLLNEFAGYKKLLKVEHPNVLTGGSVHGDNWQLQFNACVDKEPVLCSGAIITTVTWSDIEQARSRLHSILHGNEFHVRYAEWRMVMGGLF